MRGEIIHTAKPGAFPSVRVPEQVTSGLVISFVGPKLTSAVFTIPYPPNGVAVAPVILDIKFGVV